MTDTSSNNSPAPWWKFGHVWMVIAGPALVVVASFATYYIAVSGMDKVIDEPVAVSAPTETKSDRESFAPAVQARNHVVTGTGTKP